ncbi:uncharacterized protein B0I36DRAFT_310955 [Microdochium trichocladiopsis]|uniref:Uncharacterized protein n=1 Tax=Microdochium trichocladiopsis TaxID=1682393 RepID=A0A9P9BZW9_9PEZI|nr:uncharacterized protein B0I36DRAFT_310955 [Microdochium trichocladiopsis]KAH7040544.1 hypothetical protein B0I36DRAFT_310955 [Microdochium trichocladiopsis]
MEARTPAAGVAVAAAAAAVVVVCGAASSRHLMMPPPLCLLACSHCRWSHLASAGSAVCGAVAGYPAGAGLQTSRLPVPCLCPLLSSHYCHRDGHRLQHPDSVFLPPLSKAWMTPGTTGQGSSCAVKARPDRTVPAAPAAVPAASAASRPGVRDRHSRVDVAAGYHCLLHRLQTSQHRRR